jgi:hypothetical protein
MIPGGVRNIDLGSSNAESDSRLAEYFVTTPYVKEALGGRKTLFLGRKGSGKSALFREFPRLLSDSMPAFITVSLTPDEYLWEALRRYRETGLSDTAAHRNAWKLTLAVQISAQLVAQNYSPQSSAERSAEIMRQFLTDNFGDPVLPPGGVVKVLSGLRSFNLSAFGFGAGVTKDAPSEEQITPGVIGKLMELIALCLTEVGVVVLIDRLDEEWDGSYEAERLLIALLMVAKDLNDSIGPDRLGGGGLKVLVFLRSDIYGGLGTDPSGPQFDDQDKHRGTEQVLTWTVPELRQMVTARLPEGLDADDLFEAGQMRGESSAFSYIVTRTFLRPREVIQFVEACQLAAATDADEITKDTIRAAEQQYSRWKVADLKREFARVHPELPALLEALQLGYQRYVSFEEIGERIAKSKPELVEQHGLRQLLEILFVTSVIGVRPGDSGKIKFRNEDSDLALPPEAAVSIHQSLRKGLDITERRDR